MPLDTKLAAIREQLPAVRDYAYLNTGTYGPMPLSCQQAMIGVLEAEVWRGRIAPAGSARTGSIKDDARAALARLIGAEPANVALTRNTTEGMNLAVFGQRWAAGDEIVTTNIEHGGGLLPVRLAERRFGLTVRQADLTAADGDVFDAIAPLIGERTRLVALSNVSWSTGALFDLSRMIAYCRPRGVLVAVDGAQSAGAVPTDMAALDVDYYAFPGQKWLMGPSGTGGLYVRSALLEATEPTIIGTGAVASHADLDNYLLWPSAKRFEGATTANLVGLAGLTASLRFLLDDVGLEWAIARQRDLADQAIAGLGAIAGVEVVTPPSHAPLVCFRVGGQRPADVVARLAEQKVIGRSVEDTGVVRFSTGFYVLEEEIDRAVDLVAQLAS
ncbi:MAG TPA: aminotransferase class V-fold PLP-dependent enzyme [Chloroflexota bacterium]